MAMQDTRKSDAEIVNKQKAASAKTRIPEMWNTDRLFIRKATTEDLPELKQIGFSWDNKLYLEGDTFSEEELEKSILQGDLPPLENADPANYYLMVMQGADGRLIGFFDLYHGYPDSETAWLGFFIVNKADQDHSYGKEALESIFDQCKASGWGSMGLGVYLKNWKGLRFWKNNGFNRIIGIYGDKEYSESTFSIIGLKKELV